jgi:hypothetical protein
VPQPHLERPLVGALRRDGAAADTGEQVTALQHFEVLADRHRGDPEPADEIGDAHAAGGVEEAQDLLLPLVLGDAPHRTHPQYR